MIASSWWPVIAMSKPKVFVSFPVLPSVRALFEARAQACFNETQRVLTSSELLAAVADCDAVFVTATDRIDAALIAALPASVRFLGTYSVGFDHIDLAAAQQRGIAVLYTPDVLTDAVAETAMLLMLGAMRRATESIDLLRSRRWQGWTPVQLPGKQLTRKRLGVFGMGRIGRAIATRARAFGMEIHYHNTRRLPPELELGAQFHATVENFLSHSQVLLLACPLNAQTQYFLNAARIAQLPQAAVVVNIARGVVIDDDALIPALQSGRIAAAGLDVFSNEPNIDPRYYALPNAFILPHIGSSTLEAREAMACVLLDGVEALRSGVPASNRLI